jgi:hypothetical protein
MQLALRSFPHAKLPKSYPVLDAVGRGAGARMNFGRGLFAGSARASVWSRLAIRGTSRNTHIGACRVKKTLPVGTSFAVRSSSGTSTQPHSAQRKLPVMKRRTSINKSYAVSQGIGGGKILWTVWSVNRVPGLRVHPRNRNFAFLCICSFLIRPGKIWAIVRHDLRPSLGARANATSGRGRRRRHANVPRLHRRPRRSPRLRFSLRHSEGLRAGASDKEKKR